MRGPIAQQVAAARAKLSPMNEGCMIEPFRMDVGDGGPEIAVGSGYRIARTDPARHVQQAAVLSEVLGFSQIRVSERQAGAFVVDRDGDRYHGSGAYAGGSWHFALSRRM